MVGEASSRSLLRIRLVYRRSLYLDRAEIFFSFFSFFFFVEQETRRSMLITISLSLDPMFRSRICVSMRVSWDG